ncbi:MAG: sugar phosphate isomerase/epimerase family protein [Thermoguttaceae bacterium]
MFLGYNTNGLAHHDLFDAVRLLASIGYAGVAITIDHKALSPFDKQTRRQIAELKKLLRDLDMRSVIETGARFLLDPHVKHEPTLLSADAGRRIDFYKYAVDCAAELGSDCVSLWSGSEKAPKKGSELFSPNPKEAMKRLVQGLGQVLDYAEKQGVVIAFEPEPGMLIDSLQGYEELVAPPGMTRLMLTLDIGHLQCQAETPLEKNIRRWASRTVNVHLEDMKTGIHEHLMFGQGEIDFASVFSALAKAEYRGGIYVELNRHSHEAPQAAQQAMEFLGRMASGR